MGLKKPLIIFCTVLMAIFCVYSYKEVVSKNHELKVLKDRIVSLENQIIEVSNLENEEVNLEKAMSLKDGFFDIELYSNYSIGSYDNGIEMLWKPAFGPICILNRSAIENSDSLRIIEKENDFLTRISIEGVVPTWVLKESKGSGTTYIEEKQMYLVEDSTITLTPEDTSIGVNKFRVGKVVKVLDSYEDWVFIDAYRCVDANEIYKGWVKSTALGYYDDLKSNKGIEVLIKEGFEPEWAQEFPGGLWGEIYDESEDTYYLSLYGGSGIDIKKENVESFITLKQ